ncbi:MULTISPECIES: DUF2637 domain-containing protein [Kitasatospora]|uniref:DUF2637 domain-containing protein n=1 Tax=Kitasatospora cathayae TaxID=3004092 RepID=A0ABY7QHX0_9ACTN|nr:DUF2637 domain-containing protein [Kitasatospora sp. HUAS 3-15]WBP92081.1 DUF2637 domain-containing protein [Kitasatospora sp. HUAS 3-15]
MYESTDTNFNPYYAAGFIPDDEVIHNHSLWPPAGQLSADLSYPVGDGWADPGLQSPPNVEAVEEEVGLLAMGFRSQLIGNRHARRPSPAARRRADVVGSVIGFLTATIVTVVCVLGWTISYHPLQDVALSQLPRGLSQCWPIVVYGPWMAASLSVLRAALGGRKVANSWTVILVFAGIASLLCIVNTPNTMPEAVVAGLPPVTAVVSLQQLVRQLLVSRQVSQEDGRQKPSHRASR